MNENEQVDINNEDTPVEEMIDQDYEDFYNSVESQKEKDNELFKGDE